MYIYNIYCHQDPDLHHYMIRETNGYAKQLRSLGVRYN